jgi:mono/diheme cytochrome c family protein
MKFPSILALALGSLVLAACNFTLASDITPPPDYVSPTPMPTLGALYPASAPDVQDGATIFAQNCSPCHGDKGLGDGPQSMQLPVTVPGIGLPEVARAASPAEWFKVVTQGNLDRFMPPFVGALDDQERWDVISYVFTLHTTPDQIAQGKALFEANCAGCTGKFSDQTSMAALSENDLVKMIKNGENGVPAFGKDFTDEQAFAVAAYLRTLTFTNRPQVAAASTPTASVMETPSVGNGSPEAATNSLSTPGTTTAAGIGTVSGSVQLASGAQAANVTVNLQGFDHAQDQTSGPQQVLSLTATTGSDGSYKFENVAMPENRIFLAEVEYAGIKYHSGFDAAQAGTTEITLPTLKLYESSNDPSLLKVDQVHIYTDFATAGTVQILEILAFTNPSDKSVVISSDGTSLSIVKLPDGAQNVGYEAGQGSAPFVVANKGIAVVPTDTQYSIIIFFNMPYNNKLDLNQSFAIEAPSLVLLIPDGINVNGTQLMDKGIQVIQNNNYQEFSATDLKAGEMLSFSVSGQPRTSSAAGIDTRQGILIGGGALGGLLIIAGVFLFYRDRHRKTNNEDGTGFESTDEVMDAILALDDLHRAGKSPDRTYKNRRDELKEILRGMS